MDKETAKIIRDGKEVRAFVESDGWSVVKDMLIKKIVDLGNILTIEDKDNLMAEIGARQEAIKILRDWLTEVEGMSEVSKVNDTIFTEYQEKLYIDFGR